MEEPMPMNSPEENREQLHRWMQDPIITVVEKLSYLYHYLQMTRHVRASAIHRNKAIDHAEHLTNAARIVNFRKALDRNL